MDTPICQSCGMPMKLSTDHGSNADNSANNDYCTHCYQSGQFTFQGTKEQFIEKQVQVAQEKMEMTEKDARILAESMIPQLNRWKS